MHAGKCNEKHIIVINRVVKYCVDTPNQDCTILPKQRWNGKDKDFLFELTRLPNASSASYKITRRIASGIVVLFEGIVIVAASEMQQVVALSTTEAEVIVDDSIRTRDDAH